MLYEHNAIEQGSWEQDNNGFLRVRARMLSAGVMEYGADELPSASGQTGDANINVPPEEMFDPRAMYSLEGMPVVAGDHEWIEVDESRKDHEIGSIAGSARENGPYLEADIVIRDPDTIEKIKSGELSDISAGYLAEFDMSPGEYSGVPYAGSQREIRFNHVAILPPGTGRGGRDVRILNKGKDNSMEFTSVNLADGRSVRVANADADVLKAELASRVTNEAMSAQQMDAMMTQMGEAKEGMAKYQAMYDEAAGQMTEMKAKMDEMMAPATMQNAVDEMATEQAEGAEMLENMEEGMEKKEAMNSLKGKRGHELRLTVVNSIRKAGKKPELTAEQAKTEGYVQGVFNAMKEFSPSKPKSKVPGSEVITNSREKFQNKMKDDPLGITAFQKSMRGNS